MTAPFRNRGRLAWAVGLILATALVSVALNHGKEVEDPVLGSEWKCSHIALLTSCTRIPPVPAVQSFRTGPILFHPV